MKRVILVGFVATSLALMPGPVVATSNQMVVAPILERMGQAFNSLQSLKASLQQQKTYGQLGITDPMEQGSLFIKRKDARTIHVRLEIAEPVQRILTVKDNQFTLFQPSINQAIEGRVEKVNSKSSAAGFLSYFFGGISRATEDYNISALGDEVIEGRRTAHLRLTPRSDRKGLYRQIDLWVDNQYWMPTQQRLQEANQEITTLRLADLKINANIPDKVFTQQIPSRVQRVKG
jgi:outer membrane lipoprotein-sorting protein